MKVLDKIALVVFSTVILIESIIVAVLIFGWLDVNSIGVFLNYLVKDSTASNITLGIVVVFLLLAIKAIFFTSETKKEDDNFENGVLLQNENGKLLISKDTIQNLVNGVVAKFTSAQNVSSQVILGKDNGVNVEVMLYVTQEAVIKELSNNLQIKIKETVKKSLDLDVKEVNIKVKNIAATQQEIQG